MSGEHLGKVRRKLEQATDLIEAADQKTIDCKHENLTSVSNAEKLEVDLQSSKRRIVLIQEDLRVTTERLAVNEDKLSKTTSVSEEVEKAREELESHESEHDEKIQNLEESIKEMKRNCEMNELKVVEAERKAEVCTNDIQRIKDKAEKSESRVKALEDEIEAHGKSLSELEEREGAAGDKETLNEEKMEFLERELKDTSVRAETAERMCAVLKNTILETENEINGWVGRREDIDKQMLVMDDVADDPAYLCFEQSGEGGGTDSGRSTPANTFGAKAELFGKKKEDGGSRSGSRAGQNEDSGSRPETPQEQKPAPAPVVQAAPPPAPAPAPAPAEEESEEEESDDDWS